MPEPDESANTPRSRRPRGRGRVPAKSTGHSIHTDRTDDGSPLAFQKEVLAKAGELSSADATSILVVSDPQIAENDRKRGWHVVGQGLLNFAGVSAMTFAVALAAKKVGLDPVTTSTLVLTAAGSTTVGGYLRQLRGRGRRNNGAGN